MQIDPIAADAATESRATFTASPKALEAAAAFLAKRVIERRNSIPILSHIRIEATPAGAVILSGTDLDQLARVTIAADVESPGTICVEAGPLADALAKLRKGGAWEVRFADKGGCRAKVNASGVRAAFDLRGLPADDFPATVTPTVDEALSAFTVAAAPFLSDLAALAPCISTEETRYYLNGIALQVRDMAERPRLILAATDGHNMAVASRPIPVGAEALVDSILPRKAVANLAHAAKLAGDVEAIAVEFEGDRAARFTLGAVEIETKLIDGTFPDWSRPFEGNLTPIADADAPLFPELVAGAPLAAMAKLEKGAGQVVEWQEAASGRIGAIPADPDMVFGCMNVAAIGEPVKGYRYGYEHDRDTATRYLVGQAERRHGPIPFAWSKRLQVEGGEAVGLTVGETKWIPGEYVERPNWETLVVESVYIEGRTEWCEGAYSVLMPREDRRQLRADVTLEIDGDATVYPIATNSGGKIHLSADQVRNIAGDSVFETLALTIAGKVVYVLAWLFAQGDSRFLTVRSDGRCFAGKDRHKAQYLTLEQVEAALRGEEVVEAVEICPPEAAGSDSGPCAVAEAPEAPEALCEAVSGQDEPVTIADKLPAPEAVKDSLTTDPVAALLARVEALEAAIATLSGESSRGAIGEIEPMPLPAGDPRATGAARTRLAVVSQQQPKRSAAHERAIRRAWAERKARREAEAERLRVVDLARDARAERDTLRQQLENARRAVEDQREVSAAFEGQWRMAQDRRLATVQRARRMIATARKAERFQRQRGGVLHAQLTRIRSDMVDPSQPERASDIARLIRERDEARNAAAASQARAVRAEAATATMADKFEDLVSRVARAEAALRKAA